MKDLIEKKQLTEVRKASLPPPQGLYLMSVNYNPGILEKYRIVEAYNAEVEDNKSENIYKIEVEPETS